MSKHQNNTWSFRVSAHIQTELDEFQNVVAQFKFGAINESQFRIVRVPAGVYEQRENGTYMLRVRCPAGGVTPAHLRQLGEVSLQFGNGLLHITTRQEFQIHRVPLDAIILALRSLANAGLPPKAAATPSATLRPAGIPMFATIKSSTWRRMPWPRRNVCSPIRSRSSCRANTRSPSPRAAGIAPAQPFTMSALSRANRIA
jgi:hypothetical protein